MLSVRISNGFFADLAKAIEGEARKQGYSMIAMLTQEYGESIQPYVEKMCRYDLDGMIVTCDPFFSEKTYQYLFDSKRLTEIDKESGSLLPDLSF